MNGSLFGNSLLLQGKRNTTTSTRTTIGFRYNYCYSLAGATTIILQSAGIQNSWIATKSIHSNRTPIHLLRNSPSYFTSSSIPNCNHRTTKKHQVQAFEGIRKMSSDNNNESSGEYHEEIKKAMAMAKEMRNVDTDAAPTTIFDKIISGIIPCNKVYEDDVVLAFHDVNPVAPIHILVIPKVRAGLTQLCKANTVQHETTLGHLMMVASQIGKTYCKENGYRIVINDGEHGGQSVYHLHVHVIGGRQMNWPPG